MDNILLSSPVAFIILFAVIALISCALSSISYKRTDAIGGGAKPYACGEDSPDPRAMPDYGQFFHFAFFFTILHVTALVIATIPKDNAKTFAIALVYILGALVGLKILFRRAE